MNFKEYQMKTVSDVANKYFPCNCGIAYLSRGLNAPDCPYHSLDWEKAMQEVAELSYEAGWSRGYEYSTLEDENIGKFPDHEQFIQQLFPNQINNNQ